MNHFPLHLLLSSIWPMFFAKKPAFYVSSWQRKSMILSRLKGDIGCSHYYQDDLAVGDRCFICKIACSPHITHLWERAEWFNCIIKVELFLSLFDGVCPYRRLQYTGWLIILEYQNQKSQCCFGLLYNHWICWLHSEYITKETHFLFLREI